MYDTMPYPTVRLEEIVDVLDHLRAPVNGEERSRRVGTVPYYGANGQQGWIDEPLTNEPLILLAEDGGNFDAFAERPIAYRIDGPAWVNNHAHIIRAKPGVSQSFVFWSIVHKDIRQFIAGGTRTKLTQAELRRIEVQSPGEPERARIAEVLDTLDTTIRQTEAIIAKLKQVKQGLLHDLLTRGIDANGELRPPQSEAPHLYKDSPLGWIPVNCMVSPAILQCDVITKGTTPATDAMWQGNEGVRFLRVDNLSFDGQFDFNASNFRIGDATHRGALARSRCVPGDVLTNIVGPPLGKLGLVTEELGEVNVNQAIALFRPKKELNCRFLLLWLGSSISQVWLRSRAKQTSGQVNLTLALCQELPVPVLPLAEQKAVVGLSDAAHERIESEVRELAKLNAVKAGLMDDLLTGRVRVTPLLEAANT